MKYSEKEVRFDETYMKYKDLLFRIAFPYLKNKQDCEDVLQEVFIKLIYKAPKFTEDEQEKRWLIRVTVNLCKNHLKLFWNRNTKGLDGLEHVAMDEKEKYVMEEVLKLSDKYKAVVFLHFFEGYQYNEIAQILKIGESAVKMRMKRAKELLRLEMEELR